jgi:hypothetical protein
MDSTESISKDLHEAGITDWNFHVMSKDHESGLYRRHIHSANVIHKSDVIHSAERGLFFGFLVGLFFAWLLSIQSVFGGEASTLALFLTVVFCTMFGAWYGGFIGIQSENYKLKGFHDKLEAGYYLIMVDVEVDQHSLVFDLMKSKHPEAEYCASGSSMIMPFEQPEVIKQ